MEAKTNYFNSSASLNFNYTKIVEFALDLLNALDNKALCAVTVKQINNYFVELKNMEGTDETQIKIFLLSIACLNFSLFFLKELDYNFNNQMKHFLKGFIIMNSEKVEMNISIQDKLKKFNYKMKNEKVLFKSLTVEILTKEMNSLKNYLFKPKSLEKLNSLMTKLIKNLKTVTFSKLFTIIHQTVLFKIFSDMNFEEKKKYESKISFNFERIKISSLVSRVLVPRSPFITSQLESVYKWTLILDLDETLIHNLNTSKGGYFLVRPFVTEFLETVSKLYEIVIFTASAQDYADEILNKIDPKNKFIKHRLYRQHLSYTNEGNKYKDLLKVGRDIEKTIIIDNNPKNFVFNFENGIHIPTWTFNPWDDRLEFIIKPLVMLALSNVNDIREVVPKLIECMKSGAY